MSTADGLVVSSTQIIANDLYRRTIVPIVHPHLTDEQLDQRILLLSRISTVVVLLICMCMAWFLIDINIVIIIWIGVGGMMAAFAGPLVMGALWSGVTRQGAYAGLLTGFFTFVLLYTQLIDPMWFDPGTLHNMAAWLHGEGPNPGSCAVMGEIVSVFFTFTVSKLTQPLLQEHIDAMFGTAT